MVVDCCFTHLYITTHILQMFNELFCREKMYCVYAALKALKNFSFSFLLWVMVRNILLKLEQFWYFAWQISVCVLFLPFSLAWSGRVWVGKRWCHILLCTNQNLAVFKSKCDDTREVVCSCCQATVNQIWSNHTHTARMKHISWVGDC